jgi:hypothetical protein
MNLNKVFELFPGAKLGIARVRPIRAGVPVPANHTAGVTGKGGSLKKLCSFLLCAAFTLCLTAANLTAAQAVNLGSAASFAVLAGTEVTTAGASVVTGDLGLCAATGPCTGAPTVTGFPPGVVNGTMHVNDTAAQHAQASLTIAINDAAGRRGAFTAANTDQCGLTLHPGLYRADTTLSICLTGPGYLYLKGNGVYVIQIGTGLTVGDGTTVVLESGALAANVFWQVGTKATLGTTVAFKGIIMAGTAITMAGGVTLDGSALAKAEVTLDGAADTITLQKAGKGPKK